jgi:hypothetical protein
VYAIAKTAKIIYAGDSLKFLAKPFGQLIILMFNIGDKPPSSSDKAQQYASREQISTRDNANSSGWRDRIEHGSFSSRLLKLFLNHLNTSNSAI